ncbi:MAG: peptidoglycan editing factor PgeF [Anaerolineales bacterium]
MPFVEHQGLHYFTFESFPSGLIHGILTRKGGVSPEPWASLNLGGTVGDDPQRVRENRLRALEALGRSPDSVFDAWQVHGTGVFRADAPRPADMPHPKADILLTDRPQVTLLMRFADCVPIFLVDRRHGAIALIHAGWKGTVEGAARVAVQAMQAHYGTRPQDVLAGIGPSIGPDHYEVGADVIEQVRKNFGREADRLLIPHNGSIHFDLWEANRLLLESVGVEQIEIAGLCTACDLEHWYSHRAEKGRTGRFGAIFAIE